MIANWKQKLAAAVFLIGKYLQHQQSGPSWLYLVGQILELAAIGGGFATSAATEKTNK